MLPLPSAISDAELSALPASPKRIAKRVLGIGWWCGLRSWEVDVEREMYKDPERRAEVKREAYGYVVLQLAGVNPTREVGFMAEWWVREGKTSFQVVRYRDPLGLPVELFVDYGDERLSTEYNDGVSYLVKNGQLVKAREFEAWLSDWESLAR